MKLWLKLFLALLLVSVLPTWLLTHNARETFHLFTRRVQEEQMAQTGRWMGKLFREISDAAEREQVLAAHAADSGRRLRFFNAAGELIYDSGEIDPVFFDDNSEVTRAMETAAYAARWWVTADKARLYYFSAVPVKDAGGDLLGVAQVVEHTGPITNVLIRLNRQQKQGLLLTSVGAVVISILFALLLTRRLRRLEQATKRFAEAGEVQGFEMNGRDEVAELAAAFREMAASLEARQRYNREFVQTTLHELRTPLTAIHGSADLLKTRPQLSPEDRRRFSGNIQVQSDRLLHLVRELAALTALEEALPAEHPEPQPVGPMVSGILERIRPGLDHRLHLEGGELQIPLAVAPERMEQILWNLLQNADRYHCGDKHLRVRLTESSGELRLAVEDDGPGISESEPMRIFDRYFTTVARDENRAYGRGLGLAIVKRITDHYHGQVFAENREYGGATVGVVLPCADK